MSDATPGNQEATLSPAAQKEAQAPDTFYMFRLENGIVHQSSDLAYIKREHPRAVITDRVTLDSLGQAEFHPYTGQQPFESHKAASENAPEGDAATGFVFKSDELDTMEGDRVRVEEPRDADQPAKARAKR